MNHKTYLQAFYRRVPVAARVLGNLLSKKANLDAKLQRTGFSNTTAVEQLRCVIGLDHLFRPGEKRHQQSVRHYLFKFERSLILLFRSAPSARNFFIELGRKKDYEFIAKDFLSFLNRENLALLGSLIDEIGRLRILFAKQTNALQKKNWEIYRRLVREEERLREVVHGYSGEIYQLVIKLNDLRRTDRDRIGVAAAIIVLLMLPFFWLAVAFGDGWSDAFRQSVAAATDIATLGVILYNWKRVARATSVSWKILDSMLEQVFRKANLEKQLRIYASQ